MDRVRGDCEPLGFIRSQFCIPRQGAQIIMQATLITSTANEYPFVIICVGVSVIPHKALWVQICIWKVVGYLPLAGPEFPKVRTVFSNAVVPLWRCCSCKKRCCCVACEASYLAVCSLHSPSRTKSESSQRGMCLSGRAPVSLVNLSVSRERAIYPYKFDRVA